MALLNLADAVRLGSLVVNRIYAGITRVWPNWNPTELGAALSLWRENYAFTEPTIGRVNLLNWSESRFNTSPWGSTNFVQAPLSIAGFEQSAYFPDNSIQRTLTQPAVGLQRNETCTFSFYVEKDDGTIPVLGIGAGADFFLFFAGTGITVGTFTAVSATVYRYTHTAVANVWLGNFIIQKPTATVNVGIKFSGFQVNRGADVPYVKTGDYFADHAQANPTQRLFSDNAGFQSATVNGPVGMILAPDATFGADMTLPTAGAWTGAASQVGDAVTLTKPTAGGTSITYSNACVPTVLGRWIAIEIEWWGTTVSGFTFSLSSISNGRSTQAGINGPSGTRTLYVMPNVANGTFSVSIATTAVGSVTFRILRIREISGAHEYQIGATARPILRGTPTGGNVVVNGTFDTDTSGWTGTNISWVGGKARLTGIGTLNQTILMPGASVVRVRWNQTIVGGTRIRWRFRTVADNADLVAATYATGSGDFFTYITIQDGGILLRFATELAGDIADFDNIEVVDFSPAAVAPPYYTQHDGVDDGLATGKMTLVDGMDFFLVVRSRTATNTVLLADPNTTANALGIISNDVSSPQQGALLAPEPTYRVNGEVLPYSSGAVFRRQDLFYARDLNEWQIWEFNNIRFTASWFGLQIGKYTSFTLNGDVAEAILCTSQTPEVRAQIREYLANRVGITLP